MGAIWSSRPASSRCCGSSSPSPGAGPPGHRARPTALAAIEARARVDVDRIAEIERTTDHDVIAFVSQVAETVGPEGRYLHLGLTSSDVVDTALALQLRGGGRAAPARTSTRSSRPSSPGPASEAGTRDDGPHPLRPRRAHDVRPEVRRLGVRARPRPGAPARPPPTNRHGQDLAARSAPTATSSPDRRGGGARGARPARATRSAPRSSSATGTRRSSPRSPITGGSLERFATEVRNLQHTEIGEVMEPFRAGQKGSLGDAPQAQPDPVRADRRAGAAPARLRRRRHSRTSRSGTSGTSATLGRAGVLPDATILLDYMLVKTARAWSSGLVVRPERMRENIERGLGLHASSRVLLALVEEGGLSREDAYAIVQRNALRAADERRRCASCWPTDPAVAGRLSLDGPRRLLRRRALPAPRAGRHRPPRRARPRRSAVPGGDPDPAAALTPFVRSGKVRDLTGRRRPPAAGRQRPASAPSTSSCRRRSRTRAGSSPACRGSGSRETGDIVAEPPAGHRPGATCRRGHRGCPDAAELRGRMMLCRRAESCRSSHRPRLPGRRRAGRTTGAPAPSAASGCRPACARATGCPSRSSRRPPRPRRATTRTSRFDAMVELVGGRARRSGSATIALALYAPRRRRSPSGRASSSPTRSSSSGPAAGRGELLLIDEVLTPDSSRFWDAADYEPGRAQASFDKQFVRDWLERQPWDKTRRGRSCRPMSWPARGRATSRPSSGSPGRSFERYLQEDVIAR